MSIPSNKSELLEAINTSYQKLAQELGSISEFSASKNELEGHNMGEYISVKNIVSYLIGWGKLVLKWLEKEEKGEEIIFPEEGYKWNELGNLAKKFYIDYKNLNYEELCEEFEDTVKKISKYIEYEDNIKLYKQNWYKKYSKGRMIQLNTSSPYKNAYGRIRRWKKENNFS